MSILAKILKRLPHEVIYLRNEMADLVIKSVPGDKARFYARQRSGREYPVSQSTAAVTDALMEGDEITEREYLEY